MTLRIGKRSPRNNFASRTLKRPGRKIIGFTLIELILVILLVSILTALSAPLFRRTFSDLIIRNACLDMAKMINYAQEMAVIEKVKYKLNLDSEKGKYWLTKYSEPEGEEAPYKKIRGRFGKDFFMPRGLGLSYEKKEIFFYPDGRSDEVKIKILDKAAREERILEIKGFGNLVNIEKVKR